MADIRITPASSIMSFTSSLNFTEKLTQDASGSLNLYGSGSTGRTELFSIDGGNGRLFTVSDDLSDSLFSVNTIAGLPVIEAFADNTVKLGQYGQNVLVVTGSSIGVGKSNPGAFRLDAKGSGSIGALKIQKGSAGYLMQGLDGDGYSLVNMSGDIANSNMSIILGDVIGAYSQPSLNISSGNSIFYNSSVGIDMTPTATKLAINGTLGLQAAALGSAATQILVTSADPASSTRTVQTRTPTQLRSDIGAGVGSVTSVGGTGTVNGITLTGTVTSTGNLTLGGTLGSIGNSQLVNSSIQIGSTVMSLGNAYSTIAGLSSVTSTTFVGALTGNASTVTNGVYTTGDQTISGIKTFGQINATINAVIGGTGTSAYLWVQKTDGNPSAMAVYAEDNITSLVSQQATNNTTARAFRILTGTSERLRITTGGGMGLGVTSPTNTAGRFEASNDIVAYSTSDKRWKNNIIKIDSPLEKISQISGVEFDWIEDEPFHGNKGHDVGVIAQEIELVIPEAVQTRESGMKAVQYDKIIPLLIESIKEQQKQIEDLKELVNKLTK